MKKIANYIVLPRQITTFEADYLRRMNRVGLGFFALHVPVFALVAWFNDTNPLLAIALTLGVLAGPVLANLTFRNPRSVSVVYGFTAMLMGGLLVHFGQGPMQIEMHFYFFALIAMLALYGNPAVIVVAAVTVALHHLVFWIVLPSSVFNYDAPVWVVAVHAAFVVLESVATCFIARSFFDNVIGLEKIVEDRTRALDARNRDLRLVLDHVGQGFLTVDRSLAMSRERSKILDAWLGPAPEGATFADYLSTRAADTGAAFRFAWSEVVEGVMPVELTIDQLPKRFEIDERHFRLDCTPIAGETEIDKALVVVSDVTADVERERLEAEQRDVLGIASRLGSDRAGVLEFFAEAREQIDVVCGDRADVPVVRRALHTLKGNAMIFGLMTVADVAHRLEGRIDEIGAAPSATERAELATRWNRVAAQLDPLIGERGRTTLELEESDYDAVLAALRSGRPRDEVERMVAGWRFEPTLQRLTRIGQQADGIAERLAKRPIEIVICDGGLKLDPARWSGFWSAFIHVVRNAIDHGIEDSSERTSRGKPAAGKLILETRVAGEEFVVAIEDDGRGVDWELVRQKARSLDLPHATEGELAEALFADGLSTRAEVGAISGRGIGMGAMRAACHERGGAMRIGQGSSGGTRVEFRFPRRELADDTEYRRAS